MERISFRYHMPYELTKNAFQLLDVVIIDQYIASNRKAGEELLKENLSTPLTHLRYSSLSNRVRLLIQFLCTLSVA